MRVIHTLKNISINRDTDENVGFLLTNRKGSYTYLKSSPTSRYHGIFFYDNEHGRMMKAIENIEIPDSDKVSQLKNNFYSVERKKGRITEKFVMPSYHNSLIYRLNMESFVEIVLDSKDAYDNREFGRHYDFMLHKNTFVIKFTKRSNSKEDSTDGVEEYFAYMAFKCSSNHCKKIDSWSERYYTEDEERNSPPLRRFVYKAMRLKGKDFAISFGADKERVVKECSKTFSDISQIERDEKNSFNRLMSCNAAKKIIKSKSINKDMKAAYMCALNSVDRLVVKDSSDLFAGLPWFFQFWSRDTLVSLRALSSIDGKTAGKIMENYLKEINDNGDIMNMPKNKNSVRSADALGWLAKRMEQLMKSIPGEKADILERALANIIKKHSKNGFITNSQKETWMDTVYGQDTRDGSRIEIQCMLLNMHRLLFKLTKNQKYKILENTLRERAVQNFWNNGILADGLGDFTARPNVFIAYYMYPELLSAEDWLLCFNNILERLWLEWGGLSTIDKSNPLFTDASTGENPKSYHRGDSWFWINNLAALILSRADKKKFEEYIKKIIEASTAEILWKGAIGCHAELSDASQLSSKGCASQLWSSAMYVEMAENSYRGL